jgi:Pyruvate/2-oxoacid:ferredoxin oxidoreductase gamma subunit
MLGAFAKATGIVPLETLTSALGEFLKGDILSKNRRCLERGFKEVKLVRV